MKSILLFLHFWLLSASALFSQSFWENANGPEGVNIKTLQYSVQGILYATENSYPFKTTFRSTDNGLHWTALAGPNDTAYITNLSIGLDGTLFCRGSNYYDIYYSNDFGDSWSFLATPYSTYGDVTSATDGACLLSLGNAIVRTYDKVIWDTLFYAAQGWPSNNLDLSQLDWLKDGRLVAAKSSFSSGSGISFLISQDAGMSWDSFLEPSPSPVGMPMLPNGQFVSMTDQGQICVGNLGEVPTCAFPPFALMPPPYVSGTAPFFVTPSGRIIVSNGYEALSSDDMGTTWLPHPLGLEGSLTQELLPGGYILKRSYFNGNTARSTDLGQTWSFSGYGPDRAWSFNWVFKGNEKVFAISNGIWRSLDGGSQWQIILRDSLHSYQGFSNLALAPDGDLYVKGAFGLWRSTNDGDTFQNISPDTSLGKFARVAVHPQTGDLYLTGSSGAIRSSDYGLTWQVLNTTKRFFIQPIAFHPSGTFYSSVLVDGQTGRQLVRSDDDGITWQEVAVSPSPSYNNFDFVQIMPDGKIIAAGHSGYATSFDNGLSWQKYYTPFGIGTLALNAAGHAYIGEVNNKRVYKTENDGQTWVALSGIPSNLSTGIINLAIAPDQNLWVCTDGDGHFKTSAPTVSAASPTATPARLEIFPNPASGEFWVKWPSEQSDEPATLILRDLMGKEVLRQNLQGSPCRVVCPKRAVGFYVAEIMAHGRRIGINKVVLK
ncbi:MAG: hypothetical protein ACKVUS_00315 [Saprospiraceae bacterium]